MATRPAVPTLSYRPNTFGNFGNFGLSNQLNGLNGMVLRETPRILNSGYRNEMKGAVQDFMGGMFGGGGSGSASVGGGGAGGYKELSDSLMGQIGQQGASQRDNINRSFDQSLDASLARLYDRGFGNSTIQESQKNSNDRERQSALMELDDNLLSQKIGVGSQIGLAGLNAANQQRNMQMQFQNQLFGNLLGGLFG